MPVLKSPGPNPLAQKGGTLRRLVSAVNPDWAHWESTVGTTNSYTTQLTDTLVEWNAWEKDKDTQLLPSLAYDWWLSQDGLTWTFKLVKGAKFHNGAEMTCADVKFMIDTHKAGRDDKGSELRRSPRAGYIARVKSVTCPDATTMLVNTDGPLPSLLSSLATGTFAVLPKSVYEGNLKAIIDKPNIGMGPFVVEKVVAGETTSYKRFADFWNQPYPYLDGLLNNNVGSSTAVYAGMRTGRAELGSIPAGNIKQEMDRGFFSFQWDYAHGVNFIDINAQRQPWGDSRVRMAMRCALNSGQYFQTVGNSISGNPDMGVYPSRDRWALPLARQKAVHPCLDPATPMTTRVDTGRKLMAELGFGPNKRLAADMLIRGTGGDTSFDTIVANMSEIYIDAKARLLDTANAYQAAYAGEFDFHPSGFITARHDPDQWLFEHFLSKSDRNYGKWTNAEMDAMLDKQSRTVDPAARLEQVLKIQEVLLKETAKIAITHQQQPVGTAPWLKDYHITQPTIGNSTTKFTRTWIDAAELKAKGG